MSIENSEVKHLRVTTFASSSLILVDWSAFLPRKTDRLPLRKSGDLNGAGLVGIFVVRPASPAHSGAKVVFRRLDRYANDCGVSIC